MLGDSFAALVGKAWGRHRFFNKTLEGALGGLLALHGRGPRSGDRPGSCRGRSRWQERCAASLVEVLPIPLDDNLGITLVSGYAMKLLLGPA